MIKNDHQLAVTKEQLHKLQYSLQHFDEHDTGQHTSISQAQRDGLESMIQELQADIDRYEGKKKAELARRVLEWLKIPDTDWPAPPYLTLEMLEAYQD